MKSEQFSTFRRVAYAAVTGLLALATPSHRTLAATETGLGLRDAVNAALAKNPLIKSIGEKVNQADSQIPVIRSTMLPNLSLIGTFGEKKDAVNSPQVRFGGEAYNNYGTDVRFSQTLFTYGSFAALEAARQTRDMARLDREISARTLTNDVILAYFAVVLRMRNFEVLKREERIVQDSLGTAERRSHTGRGQTLDVLQVKTELALLKTQVSDAEYQVKSAAATLANLLGDPRTKEIRVKNVLEAPTLQYFDTEVKLKEFRLAELERNRIAIAQVDNLKSVSLGAHLPTLGLTGDYYYNSTKQADLFADTSASWGVGLTLTVPIFSGLSSYYQQQTLNSQRMQLEYDRTSIENVASLVQVNARKKVEADMQGIVQGQEALKIATAASDEARRMYRLSVIDFMQFLEVQKKFVQAESALNTARYTYLGALCAYFIASGQELGRLVDALEEGPRK